MRDDAELGTRVSQRPAMLCAATGRGTAAGSPASPTRCSAAGTSRSRPPTARIRRGSRCACAPRRELMGRFVGRVGSARYVSDIDYAAGRVTLRVPVQYESDIDALRFEGTLRGERIEGTTLAAERRGGAVHGDARAGARAGVDGRRWRAASRSSNGRDLTGWAPRSARARGLLARAGRRAGRDAAVRRSRDGRDVRRFPLARGAQVSAGQQQRRVFARPLRGADPRRRRQGARSAAHGRRLRLHRADRRRGARAPASGRRSTSSSSAGASPSSLNGTTIDRRAGDSRHHGRRARQRREARRGRSCSRATTARSSSAT